MKADLEAILALAQKLEYFIYMYMYILLFQKIAMYQGIHSFVVIPIFIGLIRSISGKILNFITKTCLYSFDPVQPHFYIVKLGFTGVYINFLISAQNIDCGYTLEPPR